MVKQLKTKALMVLVTIAMVMSMTTLLAVAQTNSLSATVDIVVDGKTQITKTVSVDEKPVKGYIQAGTPDELNGSASVYDAILAAVGEQNIIGSFSAYGMYITDVIVNGTSCQAIANAPVVKDDGGYTSYSGMGWTYSVNGVSGNVSISGYALTEGAKIVFEYSAYNFESGDYKVTVDFVTPDGTKSVPVTVPVYPTKDYLTGSDALQGKASVYDALVASVGKENVGASGNFITGITVNDKAYNSALNPTKYFFNFHYMLSSGYDWTFSVNDIYSVNYSTQAPLKYDDKIVFKYAYWDYGYDILNNSDVNTTYAIDKLTITDEKGNAISENPTSGSFLANIDLVKLRDRNDKDYTIIASYDDNGALMSFNYMKTSLPSQVESSFATLITIPEGKTLGSVKAFVWDGLSSMVSLSNNIEK